MEMNTTTPEANMTSPEQTTDWTNYIRFSDEEFEMLRRAGVEDHRIAAMKETRERYDALASA